MSDTQIKYRIIATEIKQIFEILQISIQHSGKTK